MEYTTKTILLVEDEGIIAILETKSLQEEGFNVIHTFTGENAVEIIKSGERPVDLILMDIDLGHGIDGTETARRILKIRNLPIIFLSSHIEKEIVNKTEEITSYGYVVKNTGKIVLLASIKMAFRLFNAYRDIQQHKMNIEATNEELSMAVEELQATNEAFETANTSLKNSQIELIESERLLSGIIEFFPDAVVVINNEGRILWWNRAVEELTGAKAADMIGRGNYEYTLPFYGERRPALIDIALRGNEGCRDDYNDYNYTEKIVKGEAFMTKDDGSTVYMAGTAAALYNSHGEIVGAIESIRDITERKEMEEALTESERRLSDVIEFFPDAVFIIDRDGCITGWNRAMVKLTGFSAEQMIGKGDHEYSIPFYGERRPVLINIAMNPGNDSEEAYNGFNRSDDLVRGEALIHDSFNRPVYLSCTASPLYNSQGEIVGAIESIRDITEWKLVMDALRKSEERAKLIVEQSPEAILLYDLGINRFVEANAQAEILFGCDRTELLERDPLSFYTPRQPDGKPHSESFMEHYESVSRGKKIIFERTLRDARGTDKHCRVHLIPLPSFDRKLIRASYIDVTEQKRIEGLLRKNQAILQSMLNATPAGVAFLVDRVFQNVNTSLEKITGYPADELVGMNTLMLFRERDEYDRIGRELYRQMEREGIGMQESIIYRKDDSPINISITIGPFDRDDMKCGVTVSVLDITERKIAQRTLAEYQRRLSDIIQFFPDPILVIDASGCVQEWNRAMEQLTAVKAEEMIGKGNYEYSIPFYGDRRPILIDLVLNPCEAIEKCYVEFDRDGKLIMGEAYMPNLRGGQVYLTGNASALYDSQGNIIGAIESIRDITERKKTEEKLKQTIEQKEILMKELQHRVKNNLNVISSLLNLEINRLSDENSKMVFNNAISRIITMSSLYERLYLSPDLISIDLKTYIEDLAESLFSTYTIDADRIHITGSLAEINLDTKRSVPLGLILNELISNALKYAYPPGTSGDITINLEKNGSMIKLSVSDNGIGLPESLNHEKPKSMGLMLVKILTAQLDGSLNIDRNSGTKVTITFEL